MSTPTLTRYGELPEGYDSLDPWALDLVPERKALALSLTGLFKSSGKPFVMAINADWGTGKSLFLRMWHDHLQNEDHPCLIFNAWEHDHAGTPFLAFLSDIRAQSSCNDSRFSKTAKTLWEGVKTHLPMFLGKGVEAGASADGSIPPEAAAMAGAVAEQTVSAVFRKGDFRETFRDELKKIANKLCKDGKKPLIIMVDELDRCRPDFAIALLEDIKHLFSVDGVVFVLAVEKAQLANCITATYGLDTTGAHRYLGKFIDITMELPPPDSKAFIKRLLNAYPLPDPHGWIKNDEDTPMELRQSTFAELAEEALSNFALSPRDLAQVLCRLSLIAHIPNIHPVAAVSCLIILGEFQQGKTVDSVLEEIPNWREMNKFDDKNILYSIAVSKKMKELGCEGFRDAQWNIFSAEDTPPDKENLRNWLDKILQEGTCGDEWIQYLRSLMLLIDNVKV